METKRRSNWPLWVLLTIVVLPVLEIVVLIAIGRQIGFWPTVLAIIAIAVLGSVLLRREGRRTMQSLRDVMGGVQMVDGVAMRTTPKVPTRELSDSALVGVGALLLLLPGFVSDILAIICLLPATRGLPRALFAALLRRQGQRLAAQGGPVIVSKPVEEWRAEDGRTHNPGDDGPISPNRILPPS